MTHTQVCENAMNRECFCDCKGALHGRNPKRGVFEMKEGYQSNPNDNKEDESIDERPSESRIEQALKYGTATGRFDGETQILIDNMTPNQRKAFVDEIRNNVKSDDYNDTVRWVNRNPEIARSYSKPRTGQSKIESDYKR